MHDDRDSHPAAAVWLRFRDGQIVLTVTAGPTLSTIAAGSMHTVLESLQHEPATPAELEAAIACIEDALMPAVRHLPAAAELYCAEPSLQTLAHLAAAGALPARLDTGRVERLFNDLADIAYGMPAARLGLPTARDFTAALLVLREVLHHGDFAAVTLMPTEPPSTLA